MDYMITDFGAVADGKTTNTEAINAAVSACAANGGGRVVIPGGGTYLSGTIWLKSNVELHIETGAVLLGSPSLEDYCTEDDYEQNFGVEAEMWTGAHLIAAVECENVSLTGNGTIDGNSEAFVTQEDLLPIEMWQVLFWRQGIAINKRPGQTVAMVECKNVKVKDLTFRELPSWCVFIHGCDYVQVSGIKVFNPLYKGNTDGIDIDACRYVTVSDCIIDTGDDAIAIRSSARRLKNKERTCEYVSVTNCFLASSACAVRIGVGYTALKHIQISNLTVNRAAMLINYCTEFGNMPLTPIYDVNFSNISADNVITALGIEGVYGVPTKHVTVENVRVESERGIIVSNEKANAFEDITIRNFDIFLKKFHAELTPEVRSVRGEYVIDAKNVNSLRLENVRVFADDDIKSEWSGILHSENCRDMKITECSFFD